MSRAEVHPYEAHGIGRKEQASLVARRIYRAVADPEAAGRGLIRVIDESGEGYLFPEKLFEAIDLPASLKRKLALG